MLDDDELPDDQKPDIVLNAMNLKPTDVIADIGTGIGYFSFQIAPLVAQGKVLAVDIQPEMLELLNETKREKKYLQCRRRAWHNRKSKLA